MSDLLRVTAEGGKYEVVQRASGEVEVLRGGEPWLPTGGPIQRGSYPSKLILCMAHEIRHLRALLVTCPECQSPPAATCAEFQDRGHPRSVDTHEERAALGEATWKDLANR